MRKYILLSILIISVFYIKAQSSYRKYYELIDSAEYFINVEENNYKADKLYSLLANEYLMFENDLTRAILNAEKIKSKNKDNFIDLYIQLGGSSKYLIYLFEKRNIYFNKPVLKKRFRQNYKPYKSRKSKRVKRILRSLMIKDQFSRVFSKKIFKTDSSNAIKLKDLIKDYPELMNRKKLGTFYSELTEVLVYHQGWNNWKNEIDLLVQFVKYGWFNRSLLSSIIENKEVLEGLKFVEQKGEIVVLKSSNKKTICDKGIYFYSTLGIRSSYYKGKQLIMPLDPDIELNQINNLRKLIYYPTYQVSKINNPQNLYLTPQEYCDLLY